MMRADSSAFGWLAMFISGVLFALSRDVGPVGPLVLIAPVPLLIFALRSPRPMMVAACAFLARAIGSAGVVFVYAGLLPAPVLVSAVLLYGTEFAIVVLLTRWIARRSPTWLAVLVFPLLTTASEFLLSLASPNGTFGALGYSLVDLLPIVQLASLGGIFMLTFMASLAAMAFALFATRQREWRTVGWIAGTPWLAALIFGVWRLSQPYESEARVALAAIDPLTQTALRDENTASAVAEAYAALVRQIAAVNPQPQFVVLPEKAFGGRVGWNEKSLQVLQETADETGVTVIAGFDENLDAQRRGNTARVLSPRLPVKTYLKRRMVPGLEGHFTGGVESLVDDGYGVAICKDMDFPGLIREYGAAQTRLLLVPALDFVRDGRMHARMAVVRGIENGFALVRAASQGRLTVSDAFGRIVAERVTDPSSATTLSATVGLVSGRTLYSRTGNALAWLVVAATFAVIAWTAMGWYSARHARNRRAEAVPVS